MISSGDAIGRVRFRMGPADIVKTMCSTMSGVVAITIIEIGEDL